MVTKDKIIRKGENDMLSFESDYTEGAHEAILKRLLCLLRGMYSRT